MKQQLLVISLAVTTLMSVTAQAEKQSAGQYGVTAEMGYKYAVKENEPCDPTTDIMTGAESNDPNRQVYIRKCDGSYIGWVEVTVNGADLGPDEVTEERLNNSQVMLALGGSEINIYTCDKSRADEFEKEEHQKFNPFRDSKIDAATLRYFQATKKNFKVRLFYNEYILSGKCIGGFASARKTSNK